MPAMQDRYAVPWDADASEARALWRGHGQNCGAVEQESGRMNNDLVSREAVEQIFSKMWFTVRQNQNLTDEEVKQIITKGRIELNRLPSAQPEIIRCKDCKQFRRWIDTDICFCDITESERSDNDFCSYAERRTDE